MSEPQELQQLRDEIHQLRQRLEEVSRRLEQISSAPTASPATPPLIPAAALESIGARENAAPPRVETPVSSAQPPTAPPQVVTESSGAPAEAVPPPVAPPAESFEVRVGTYWLPRVGIAMLLTGMVFVAALVTPHLTVPLKVALGYFVCLVLGVLGILLDKKTPQFARVLQGGALALAYFVTYAAHFVDAFRVIQSPTVAIVMLSVVVLFIIAIAQERHSPTLGGLALFFGYYTSVVSGVATFTLAANAILAVAAIFFLMRNRWVHISYGAVLATYLTYMIWVWKLTGWSDLDHLIFDSGYLADQEFRLRAAFLSLYWLVFAAGALVARREAIGVAERNGLLTLNNVFFFMLFTLLMRHAHPDQQWAFQFSFGGALLIASVLAYGRLAPERSVLETLLLQAIAVGTLGLVSYFKDVQLLAALSLETVFLLVLARWMNSRWVAGIGRVVFAVAAAYAWSRYEDWDAPMRYGVWCAAAAGFIGARLEKHNRREQEIGARIKAAAFYFALVATALAMTAARQEFGGRASPWVWTIAAVIVAILGGALRTSEIAWASHLPLAWALGTFYAASLNGREWEVGSSLVLIIVTLGYGLFLWARARLDDDRMLATTVLAPYVFLAVLVTILTTLDWVPQEWRLTAFAAETLLLISAAAMAEERTLAWCSIAPLLAGVLGYFSIRRYVFVSNVSVAWWNFLIASVLLVMAERIAKCRATLSPYRVWLVVAVTAVALFALRKLVGGAYLTVSWAVLGFVLLAFGFAVKARSYRMAGLVALGFSLLRAIFHDMRNVETIYRILSFIGLGVILLVLAFLYARNREKLAKWL